MDNQPNIAEVLSGFDATRPIGQGGMASIYLYENRLTGEQVAVKTLHSHVVDDSSTLERFYHEVQASIRLDHRNIVNVMGYGDWQGKPAIVMEYIDGGDLKHLMSQVERVPAVVAAYIIHLILKGLDYSHRLGIIHRDIKPSNILIDKNGQVKITDFGISQVSDLTRLTVSGDVIGTPAYMSPEQASGKKLDERSDLFSAGVLLYELLTNANPFLAENPSVTLLNIIRCNPAPIFELNPTVPFRMEVALDRLLTRDPADRIQSAAEAAELMLDIIRELQPDGFDIDQFAAFLREPEEFIHKTSVEDSLRYLEKGKSLLAQDQNRPERAAVEFYRSLFMYPGNMEAQQYLTSITKKYAGDIQKPSEKLLELETAARNDPNNVAVLMQIIKRARGEGDFIKAISFSKRLARLRPKDVYILGQIETLLPDDHVTAIVTGSRKGTLATDDMTMTRMSRSSTAEITRELPPRERPSGRGAQQVARKTTPSDSPAKLSRMGIMMTLILGMAIVLGLFLGNQFRKASRSVEKEMPQILDRILPQGVESRDARITGGTGLTGRARELLMRAQSAYKDGDRPGAIRLYQDFLREFSDHSEADSVRIQLSRLMVADGNVNGALSILDDQIKSGTQPTVSYARLEKIRLYISQGKTDEARWECIYLEPTFRRLPSPDLQLEFLSTFAGICRLNGSSNDAIRLYDEIIRNYNDKDKILEARMLRADVLIDQGDLLEAQRELWIVRDQSRPGTLLHSTALNKLGSLGLGDPAGSEL
ncbi:protein kinase [bacterium]|nr:protein kinase [candidate division CSSED10-310 bacterium]